jgi:hypothetical protein
VEGEQPDADKVRITQGDGGIDVHVGDLTDPDGIDVYQCKFFPQGLEDIQKEQLRKSFRTCRDSSKFKTKKWTLCLPVDLSIDEKHWFEEWRNKQAETGIVIEDVWGAMKLEGLLFQEKNKGLKEAFFKEEYLTQIRQLHVMLMNLVPSIAERLNQEAGERELERRAAWRLRQDKYVAKFVQAIQEDFFALIQEELAANQGAIQSHRSQPAFWECVIRPPWIPDQPFIDSLQRCRSVVQHCQVGPLSASFPDLSYSKEHTGPDWVGGKLKVCGFECWRFSQRGLFATILTTHDELILPSTQPCISVDYMLFRLTQMFRFAARFGVKATNDGMGEIGVRLAGIKNRPLSLEAGFVRGQYCTTDLT